MKIVRLPAPSGHTHFTGAKITSIVVPSSASLQPVCVAMLPAVCTLAFLVLFCLLLINECQEAVGTLLETPGHWQDFVMREAYDRF